MPEQIYIPEEPPMPEQPTVEEESGISYLTPYSASLSLPAPPNEVMEARSSFEEAKLWFDLDRLTDTIKCCQRALTEQPAEKEQILRLLALAYSGLAQSCMLGGSREQAIEHLQMAEKLVLSVNPSTVQSFFHFCKEMDSNLEDRELFAIFLHVLLENEYKETNLLEFSLYLTVYGRINPLFSDRAKALSEGICNPQAEIEPLWNVATQIASEISAL